jgi:hypothetical protein
VLTAVPVLPDHPLSILWQSTLVDIEPGSRYQYKADAASINTTLAIVNNTGSTVEFPLLLATADPEARDVSRRRIRVGSEEFDLEDSPLDQEWDTLSQAILAAGQAQGHDPVRIQSYLDLLRPRLGPHAFKTRQMVKLEPNQERFIRTHHRKRLPERDGVFEFRGLFPLPQFALVTGGTISVAVALPRSTQTFSVDLIDWTRNFSPQAFGKDAGLPMVAGRFLVSWFWQNDPELFAAYRYA